MISLNNIKEYLLILPFVILTFFFHSEIYNPGNHPFLIVILLLFILLDKKVKFNYLQIINWPVFTFLIFIFYAYLRFDFSYFHGFDDDGFAIQTQDHHLINMVIFLFIFMLSIILSCSERKIPGYVSKFALIYIIMYIIAATIQTDNDYDLGVGTIFLTTLPFIVLGYDDLDKLKSTKINLISIFVIVILMIIGNRAASLSAIIFLLLYNIWPFLFRNKLIYYSAFISFFIFLGVIFFLYLNSYDYISQHNYEIKRYTFIGGEFFSKALDTRYDIWLHLLSVIMNQINPVIGAGSHLSTSYITPLTEYEFSMNRPNLDSHSIYLEIIYRMGLIGFILFISFIFSIWAAIWNLNKNQEIRIFAPLIIAYLWLITFQVSIFYGEDTLRDGFIFILLGFAVGRYIYNKVSAKRKTT